MDVACTDDGVLFGVELTVLFGVELTVLFGVELTVLFGVLFGVEPGVLFGVELAVRVVTRSSPRSSASSLPRPLRESDAVVGVPGTTEDTLVEATDETTEDETTEDETIEGDTRDDGTTDDEATDDGTIDEATTEVGLSSAPPPRPFLADAGDASATVMTPNPTAATTATRRTFVSSFDVDRDMCAPLRLGDVCRR